MYWLTASRLRTLLFTLLLVIGLAAPAGATASTGAWHFDRWLGDHHESPMSPWQPVAASDGSWWILNRGPAENLVSLQNLSIDGTSNAYFSTVDDDPLGAPFNAVTYTLLNNGSMAVFGAEGRIVDPTSATSTATFGGIGAGAGQWQTAADAATAPDGSIFLLDDGTNNVIHFTAAGTLIEEWGTPGSNPGELSAVNAIAVAPNGSVWISNGNRLLQHFTSAGVYLDDFTIPSGSGVGEVSDVTDMQIAANGDIVVLDTLNDRLQRFASNGAFNTQIGGPGEGDGDLDQATSLGIDRSTGLIAVVTTMESDGPGIVWYADDGSLDSSCCSHARGATGYLLPLMVATGPGSSFYVSELGTASLTQRDEDGRVLQTLGGTGNGVGQFASSELLTIDSTDDHGLWAVGSSNPTRIWHFSAAGDVIGNLNQTGTNPGQFQNPTAIDVAEDGSLWIYDAGNSRIQHLTESGSVLEVFGTAGNAVGEMSGETYGIAGLADGRVVLSQFALGRVVCYNPDGTVDWSTDSVPGLTSPISPLGLEITESGNLIVSMVFHQSLVELDPSDGSVVQVIELSDGTPTAPIGPTDTAFDSQGRMIVADYFNSRVLRLSRETDEPPVAHDVTLSIRSGVNGRNIVARRGSIDVDAAGAVGGVTWSARWKGRRVPITASGKIRVRHLSQGRGRLVVTATDGEGATGTLRRRLIVDRTAPHVRIATTTLSTMSSTGVIRFSDHLTGSTTRRINVTRLHLGINVIRVKVRDRAGNTRVVRVRITRHLSLTNHNANRGITLRNLFGHRVDASHIDINDIFSYQQPTLPWYHQTTLARPYVLELQHRLQDLHHLSRHHTTGHLDLETIRAIKRFQRRHHLPVIATAGPRTRRALETIWQRQL